MAVLRGVAVYHERGTPEEESIRRKLFLFQVLNQIYYTNALMFYLQEESHHAMTSAFAPFGEGVNFFSRSSGRVCAAGPRRARI